MVTVWEWFTINSVWILFVSATVLLIILLVRRQVEKVLEKASPKKWCGALGKGMRLAVWITEVIALIILAPAAIAVVISEEGAAAIINSETIQAWFLEHGVAILIIIFLAYLLHRLSKLAMPEIVERSVKMRGKSRRCREELAKRSQTLSSILASASSAIIIVIAIFMILAEIGVNIAPLLAGAGVAGVAIGFGAQSLIRDMLNGLFILLEDQYNKGDVVNVAGIGGMVEEVNLRRTVLRDLDGIVHTIPNGEIKTASNYTKEWSRVNLDIPVGYGEDLDHVMEVINRVGKELAQDSVFGPKIRSAPQALRVNNFGDSGIEIKILGETQPIMQWDVTGELRRRIKKAFDEEGIEIPWPHVKLYFGDQTGKDITCQVCSHHNVPGSKFCANCGKSLSS